MHDAISAERLGRPAAGIMTGAFASAAELMARVLGAEGYRFVVVEHPISSAAPAELADRARRAAAEIRDLLLGA